MFEIERCSRKRVVETERDHSILHSPMLRKLNISEK